MKAFKIFFEFFLLFLDNLMFSLASKIGAVKTVYELETISKPTADNPGSGGGFKNNLYIALATDIDEDNFPSRDADKVTLSTKIPFLAGKGWKRIYSTPDELELRQEVVGELDGKGFEIFLEIFHPGMSTEISEFLAKHANGNFYLLIEECAADAKYLVGSPCSQAKIDTAPFTSGKKVADRKGTVLTFKCESPYPIAKYTGSIDESYSD